MDNSHADVSKHVRSYIKVFVALAILTVVTVAVAQVDFPGSGNVIVALLIAMGKATLVVAIFMHLKWEKSSSIWWLLIGCAACFALLMILPVLTVNDIPPQVHEGTWGP